MPQSNSIGMTPGTGTRRIRKLRCTTTKIKLENSPSKKGLFAGQIVIESCSIYVLIVAYRSIETESGGVEQFGSRAVANGKVVCRKFACYGSQRRNCYWVLFHRWEERI